MNERPSGSSSRLSPFQSGLRFTVEIAALVGWGMFGWGLAGSSLRWLAVIAVPLIAATIWAVFRVPDDESASGEAAVPVTGVVRLLLELAVLLGAALAVALTGRWMAGAVLASFVGVHYLATTPRVRWLLQR